MSNALAQNATDLAPSGNGEANYDFVEAVQRVANKKTSGLTTSRYALHRQKLISGVVADYRAHFPQQYQKNSTLPREVYDKIQNAVDESVDILLTNAVNASNVTTLKRSFAFKSADMKYVERITAIGENELLLNQQHFAVVLDIGIVEGKIKKLEAKVTPDFELEKKLRDRLTKLQIVKQYIETQQQTLRELTSKDSNPSLSTDTAVTEVLENLNPSE